MSQAGNFWFRDHRVTAAGERIEVGVTDQRMNFAEWAEPEVRARSLAEVSAEAAGAPSQWMRQVHGNQVAVIGQAGEPVEADGLVTRTEQTVLGVRCADCVPVLIADLRSGAISAVHAGRQGVARDVVGAAVAALVGAAGGAVPRSDSELVAWVGPHVCGACYEVPEQLRTEVAHLVPQAFATTSWGAPSLDLGAGVASQLAAHGVAEIVRVPGCTMEEAALPSHRRDGARSGRLAGLIWRRPVAAGVR